MTQVATRLASRMIMYSEAIDNMKAGIERPHSNNFTGAYYHWVCSLSQISDNPRYKDRLSELKARIMTVLSARGAPCLERGGSETGRLS
jgi:hypothetical protein